MLREKIENILWYCKDAGKEEVDSIMAAISEVQKIAGYELVVDGAYHGIFKHEVDAKEAGFETDRRFDILPLYRTPQPAPVAPVQQEPVAWCHTFLFEAEEIQSPIRFKKEDAERDVLMYGEHDQKNIRVRPLVYGDVAPQPAPDVAAMKARVAELERAEEGAKEAFSHVVQQKRDLEAKVARTKELLDGAYAMIRDHAKSNAELEQRNGVLTDLVRFARNVIDPTWEDDQGRNKPMREWCEKADATVKPAQQPEGGE